MAAGNHLNDGVNWCDCLSRAGVIRGADAAVLKAAERAGNVAWALSEMADSSVRRWTYHLRLCLNVVFPIFVLVLGLLIAFVVIGLFIPVVDLILTELAPW